MIYGNLHCWFCKIHYSIAGRFLPGLELHQSTLCSKPELVPDSFWAARAQGENPRIVKVSPSSHPANAGKMLAISRLLHFFPFFFLQFSDIVTEIETEPLYNSKQCPIIKAPDAQEFLWAMARRMHNFGGEEAFLLTLSIKRCPVSLCIAT